MVGMMQEALVLIQHLYSLISGGLMTWKKGKLESAGVASLQRILRCDTFYFHNHCILKSQFLLILYPPKILVVFQTYLALCTRVLKPRTFAHTAHLDTGKPQFSHKIFEAKLQTFPLPVVHLLKIL